MAGLDLPQDFAHRHDLPDSRGGRRKDIECSDGGPERGVCGQSDLDLEVLDEGFGAVERQR